jgi:hypothetical protein
VHPDGFWPGAEVPFVLRLRLLIPSLTVLLLTAASTLGAAPALPRLTTLRPGGATELAENVTVNVVFVGYRKGAGPQQINEAAFRSQLSAGGSTVVRDPLYYNVVQPTHLSFNYHYNLVYANRAFEDAFFKHLTRIGQPGPITDYQAAYNDQLAATHHIEDNLYLDAPSVERWLAQNAGPLAKVDTRQYTVFLINWASRPDFRHHVYVKTDEPDPDTGYNFGVERQSRKLMAWGGTAPDDPQGGTGMESRVWFYDLSAGAKRSQLRVATSLVAWLATVGHLGGSRDDQGLRGSGDGGS